MTFDLLPDLHPRARRATICVRVSRKWEYRGGTDDGPIQHVDLVLIDAKVSVSFDSTLECVCIYMLSRCTLMCSRLIMCSYVHCAFFTQGNNMYGEIPGPDVETKSPLIQENGIYIISRFRVSNAKHNFRPVESRYMVEFTYHTQVSAARENMPAFPMYAYKLTPIDELRARAGDTRDFVGKSL